MSSGMRAQDERPNVILMNMDNLGYGDVGCYGSTVHRTPNIDRMSAEGIRLTSYYSVSGVCTPSRAGLMTGCYPRRVNMHVSGNGGCVLFPVDRKGLHPSEKTIATLLKGHGYATACVGKWHLGDLDREGANQRPAGWVDDPKPQLLPER